MPWTFAHPAAVLPLLPLCGAGRLSFAALVIGSLSPDFGYYLGLFELAGFAHTPWGLLGIALPSALLLLILLRRLADPVAQLLPPPHRQQLVALADCREPIGLLTLLSLALGAATHGLWDAFTHEGRFFVQHIAALRLPLFSLMGREIALFKLLQHASSLVGVVLLFVAYRRRLRRQGPVAATPCESAWLARLAWLIGAALTCALPLALAQAMGDDGKLNLSLLLVRQVIYSTSAFLLLLVGLALWRRHADSA